MEPDGSLLCSQDHATSGYPEPGSDDTHPPTLLL